MKTGLRILLVDDEKRLLESLSFLLGEMEMEVKTASRSEEALEMVARERFDIAFIDQFLGAESGLKLRRKIAATAPDLYYVMITANGTTELAVESLKDGFSDFVTKPFKLEDIARSIEHVTRKRELDRQKEQMVVTLREMVDEKTKELDGVYFSLLASLAQAIEKKDFGTYGHCRRVTHFSLCLAAALDYGGKDRHRLKIAAMLHDVGKIGISDAILGKKGKLTEEEMEVVRSHSQKGVEILSPVKYYHSSIPGILHHHEWYDGSGYPAGLAGKEIPLDARIITVADTYDAILSSRPYRDAGTREKAIQELQSWSGKQFDPEVVEIFVKCEKGMEEFLSPPADKAEPVEIMVPPTTPDTWHVPGIEM
jgi:response regulator RpfG family c-di-GMP phosphodiesterase